MINNGLALYFPIVIIIYLCTYSIPGAASDCNCSKDSIGDFRDLIHQAAVVDENGRRTEEEYATFKVKSLVAVQDRFSPTGILKCNGAELSAQLTGSNDVITTAGHGFIDRENCKKISAPESCTFTVKIGKSERVSRVTNMVGIGFECPIKPIPSDDWAVLKIDPPLNGIEPYGIPDDIPFKEDDDVISVSAMARDFVRIDPTTKKSFLPKTIEECKTKKILGIQRPAIIESNCDFARGNSGGSLLKVVQGRDILLAISISNKESEAMLRASEKRGTPNAGPYKSKEWATFHVPLNAEFLETVKKAVGNRSL